MDILTKYACKILSGFIENPKFIKLFFFALLITTGFVPVVCLCSHGLLHALFPCQYQRPGLKNNGGGRTAMAKTSENEQNGNSV